MSLMSDRMVEAAMAAASVLVGADPGSVNAGPIHFHRDEVIIAVNSDGIDGTPEVYIYDPGDLMEWWESYQYDAEREGIGALYDKDKLCG